eukprot:Nk52_evm3s359 gene=Nk52_evmTU3s359
MSGSKGMSVASGNASGSGSSGYRRDNYQGVSEKEKDNSTHSASSRSGPNRSSGAGSSTGNPLDLQRLVKGICSSSQSLSKKKNYLFQLNTILRQAKPEYVRKECFPLFTKAFPPLLNDFKSPLDVSISKIIGLCGVLLGQEGFRFSEWVFAEIFKSTNEQRQILLLGTLVEALYGDVSHVFASQASVILKNTLRVLENSESQHYLRALTSVIKVLANDYPHILDPFFQDIVDMLMGWMIDIDVAAENMILMTECIESMSYCWAKNPGVALDLIKQFKGDIESLVEESRSAAEDEQFNIIFAKCYTYLYCFSATVRGLKDFMCLEEGIIASDLYVSISEFLMCCKSFREELAFRVASLWDIRLAVVYFDLGSALGERCSCVTDSLVGYICEYILPSSSEETILKWLESVTLIISKSSKLLHMGFYERFVESTFYQSLWWHYSPQVVHSVVALNKIVLSSCHSDIFDFMYGILVQNLKLAYRSMVHEDAASKCVRHYSASREAKSLVDHLAKLNEADGMNSMIEEEIKDFQSVLGGRDIAERESGLFGTEDENCKELEISMEKEVLLKCKKKAEILFLVCIRSLQRVLVQAPSFPGFWQISVSPLQLLVKEISCFHPRLGVNFPSVQFVALEALYVHCESRNFFLEASQSERLGSHSSKQSEISKVKAVINAIVSVVSTKGCNEDVEVFCLKWFRHIFGKLIASSSEDEVSELKKAVLKSLDYGLFVRVFGMNSHSPVKLIRVLYGLCIRDLCLGGHIEKQLHLFLFMSVLPRFGDSCCKVRNIYVDIFTMLPVTSFHCREATACRVFQAHMLSQLIALPGSSAYGDKGILFVLEQLFGVSYRDSKTLSRLEEILENSGSMSHLRFGYAVKESGIYSRLMQESKTSGSLIQVWNVIEIAKLIVSSKLKTPYGPPAKTFEFIESRMSDLNLQIQNCSREKKGGGLNEHNIKYFVVFIEALEKYMKNAYFGTVHLPDKSKSCTTFFKANRKVCEEWLVRLSQSLVNLSFHSSYYCGVIKHSSARLNALRLSIFNKVYAGSDNMYGYFNDYEKCVMELVKSCVNLRESEFIEGLAVWNRKWLSFLVKGAKKKDMLKPLYFVATTANDLEEVEWMPWLRPSCLKAQGRYEEAVVLFQAKLKSLLGAVSSIYSEFKIYTLDPSIIKFIVDEIVDCYSRLCDHSALANVVTNLASLQKNFSGSPYAQCFETSAHANTALALSYFSEGKHKEVADLIDSKYERVSDNDCIDDSLTTFDVTLLKRLSQWELSQTSNDEDDKCHHFLVDSLERLRSRLSSKSISSVNELIAVMFRIQFVKSCEELLFDNDRPGEGCPYSSLVLNFENVNKIDPIFHECYGWNFVYSMMVYLQKKRPEIISVNSMENLKLKTMNLARKQSNFKLASNVFALKNDVDDIRFDFQNSKIQFQTGNYALGFENLKSVIISNVSKAFSGKDATVSGDRFIRNGNILSKSFLTLGKWLSLEKLACNESLMSCLTEWRDIVWEQGSSLKNTGVYELSSFPIDSEEPTLSKADASCGMALFLSCVKAPTSANSWFRFAAWAYRQGYKVIDTVSSKDGHIDLSEEEFACVEGILKIENAFVTLSSDMQRIIRKKILEYISKVDMSSSDLLSKGSAEEDISKPRSVSARSQSDVFRVYIASLCPGMSEASIESLLKVYQKVSSRIWHYYQLSIYSYDMFLKTMCSGNSNPKVDSQLAGTEAETISDFANDRSITATLRILRLLVKYGRVLEMSLSKCLRGTYSKAWKGIVPQLFARMNHPDEYVREQVMFLLVEISKESPHLIIYPSVIGETQGDPEVTEDTGPLKSSEKSAQGFRTIMNSLNQHWPALVSEVQVLIDELRRITVLWEEQWLECLLQVQPEVSKKMKRLEAEAKRVNDNSTLDEETKRSIVKEKYDALLMPVISTLERMMRNTISKTPETVHEEWFVSTYASTLKSAFEQLSNPASLANLASVWMPFAKLGKALSSRCMGKNNQLRLERISPRLAEIDCSVVPMPGLSSSGTDVVTLQKFDDIVRILPTKTKPKKLVLIGSNGNRYSYLFKGMDDLHLDERIMQFLSIANEMFLRAKNENIAYISSHCRPMRARHYSVIPLGAHSGLIQWVDGAVPAFTLYKEWLNRDALSRGDGKKTGPIRPSELFYNKLIPLFKAKGIDSFTSRDKWPKSDLLDVFKELKKETPSELISTEIWCSCASANEWWNITKSFSRSLAVMSVVGYVLGLGDRHLDNILIDFKLGEVVHIDYNICFEKGKKLRVPEVVPFRLTHNFISALGITGVEGVFRSSCEQVLSVMRQNKETLLTLLEAFVYDPLIDWTDNSVVQEEKKEMEINMSFSLFVSRIAEIRVAWSTSRESIDLVLVKVLDAVNSSTDDKGELLSSTQSVKLSKVRNSFWRKLSKCDDERFRALQSILETKRSILSNFNELALKLSSRLNQLKETSDLYESVLSRWNGPLKTQIFSLATSSHSREELLALLNIFGVHSDAQEELQSLKDSIVSSRKLLFDDISKLMKLLSTYFSVVGSKCFRSGAMSSAHQVLYQNLKDILPPVPAESAAKCGSYCDFSDMLASKTAVVNSLYNQLTRLHLIMTMSTEECESKRAPSKVPTENIMQSFDSSLSLDEQQQIEFKAEILWFTVCGYMFENFYTKEVRLKRSLNRERKTSSFLLASSEHNDIESVIGDSGIKVCSAVGLVEQYFSELEGLQVEKGSVMNFKTSFQRCLSSFSYLFLEIEQLHSNFSFSFLKEGIDSIDVLDNKVVVGVQEVLQVCADGSGLAEKLNCLVSEKSKVSSISSLGDLICSENKINDTLLLVDELMAQYEVVLNTMDKGGLQSPQMLGYKLISSLNDVFSSVESSVCLFEESLGRVSIGESIKKRFPIRLVLSVYDDEEIPVRYYLFLLKLQVLEKFLTSCFDIEEAFAEVLTTSDVADEECVPSLSLSPRKGSTLSGFEDGIVFDSLLTELETLKYSYFSSMYENILSGVLPKLCDWFVTFTLQDIGLVESVIFEEIMNKKDVLVHLASKFTYEMKPMVRKYGENQGNEIRRLRDKGLEYIGTLVENAQCAYMNEKIDICCKSLSSLQDFGVYFEWSNDRFLSANKEEGTDFFFCSLSGANGISEREVFLERLKRLFNQFKSHLSSYNVRISMLESWTKSKMTNELYNPVFPFFSNDMESGESVKELTQAILNFENHRFSLYDKSNEFQSDIKLVYSFIAVASKASLIEKQTAELLSRMIVNESFVDDSTLAFLKTYGDVMNTVPWDGAFDRSYVSQEVHESNAAVVSHVEKNHQWEQKWSEHVQTVKSAFNEFMKELNAQVSLFEEVRPSLETLVKVTTNIQDANVRSLHSRCSKLLTQKELVKSKVSEMNEVLNSYLELENAKESFFDEHSDSKMDVVYNEEIQLKQVIEELMKYLEQLHFGLTSVSEMSLDDEILYEEDVEDEYIRRVSSQDPYGINDVQGSEIEPNVEGRLVSMGASMKAISEPNLALASAGTTNPSGAVMGEMGESVLVSSEFDSKRLSMRESGQYGSMSALAAKKEISAKGSASKQTVQQEKNVYAVGVWKKVKAKLEGRDFDPSKRISVQEQVDFIIEEATSSENLSVMYEGWTSWI